MSARASAARYARALLDVGIQEADPVKIGAELSSFSEMVRQHALLGETLTNPGVAPAAKKKLVSELADRLSLSAPLAKLLLLLADGDRLGLIGDLNDVYQERLRDQQQILQAEIVTAAPLESSQTEALRQRLQKVTGKEITMTTRVEPELIGGLVARIGSTVYDGSVSTRLTKMRERLLQQR